MKCPVCGKKMEEVTTGTYVCSNKKCKTTVYWDGEDKK